MITGLFALAEETRAREEEDRRRREERRLAQERYQLQMERREDERKRFQRLEDEASFFERARRLREYASAAEQKALLDDGLVAPSLTEWLDWVRAKADWLDPLIQVSDPILDAPEPEKPRYW